MQTLACGVPGEVSAVWSRHDRELDRLALTYPGIQIWPGGPGIYLALLALGPAGRGITLRYEVEPQGADRSPRIPCRDVHGRGLSGRRCRCQLCKDGISGILIMKRQSVSSDELSIRFAWANAGCRFTHGATRWHRPALMIDRLEQGLVAHQGEEHPIGLTSGGHVGHVPVLATGLEPIPVGAEVGLPLTQAVLDVDQRSAQMRITDLGDATILTPALADARSRSVH